MKKMLIVERIQNCFEAIVFWLVFILIALLAYSVYQDPKVLGKPICWEAVTGIATIIGALSLFGVIWQGLLIRRQIHADHERTRREKSVELLLKWSESLDKRSSMARIITESLSFEDVKKLWLEKPFSVDSQHRSRLIACLSCKDDIFQPSNGKIEVDEVSSSQLRWILVKYLNALESTLSAWHYNIADNEMIEEQFGYLFSEEKGHAALRDFRKAAGGARTFPCVEAFAQSMERKQTHKSMGLPPIE